MAFWDSWFGSPEDKVQETKVEYQQMPEFPEAKGAREDMYTKLQGWGQEPGYGAISPNWDEIWGDAEKKLKQYYWGSPTDPGVVGKIQADAARKGQTDQPAYLSALSKMGATESNELSSMAVKQAMEKAGFAEKGRQTWMDEMKHIMGQKPEMRQSGQTVTSSGGGGGEGWGILEGLGELAVGAMVSGDWFTDLLGGGIGKEAGTAKVSGGTFQNLLRD